ncbi:hypothetical protein FQR65_LT18238 [Abscondita terminalis]|nr:hypothetical protein FQR65_LT18238 [Abscondita terminalis]
MAGRKKFSYQNLEAMTNEEYMRLFEDIPATIESDLEDMSDNDIAEDTAEIEQAVHPDDPNFEKIVLAWYNECESDLSDIDSEDNESVSDHNSASELEEDNE